MTVQSATTIVETNGTYEDVETLTGITFASGTTYTMQVINTGYLKVGDAEFELRNQILQYKAGSETLYIMTKYLPCTLVILEEEAA